MVVESSAKPGTRTDHRGQRRTGNGLPNGYRKILVVDEPAVQAMNRTRVDKIRNKACRNIPVVSQRFSEGRIFAVERGGPIRRKFVRPVAGKHRRVRRKSPRRRG